MRSLTDDLGEECYQNVTNLLTEIVDVTINGAKTSVSNEDFAEYRQGLNQEYADSIYRTIMRFKRRKKNA